jgi:putative restriction endonuclease
MAKAVFIQSGHSPYQDRPGEVYHFPAQYLSRVAQTVGDWVIFYEGRRGGNRGYNAVQRVARIAPDPGDPTHHFAVMDRASELTFETDVPRLRPDGTPFETGLPLSRGNNTSAVRLISDADFAAIITEGLRAEPAPDTLSREPSAGFAEPAEAFLGAVVRPQILSSRLFRDASFARQVKRAYGARCAMSGLELRNGGGRPEVEAAHIVPVAADGPDSVRNGIALSGTLHWMFDRGLLSVDGDGDILIAKGSVADDIAGRLLVPDRRLLRPHVAALAPHPAFLAWHRDHLFKG